MGSTVRARAEAPVGTRLAAWAGARPVLWAVLFSRLLVVASGAIASAAGGRVAGWTAVDPARLTSSFGAVGNALLGSSVRWDSIGYLQIAQHGYTSAGQTILFPGYPLALIPLGELTGSYVASGIVVSWASFAVGLWLLHRLTQLELGRRAADLAVLLLAFAPVSLFFTAIYGEALFLALSVGAVYAARRQRWALAGLLAALASITRVTGILLLAPLGLWLWQSHRRITWRVVWLLPAPAALGGFLLYMRSEGYGILAPFKNQHAHHLGGPWSTVASALRAAANGFSASASGTRPFSATLGGPLAPGFDSIVLLIVLLLAVGALVLAARRLPLPYTAYAALTLLVSIASQTKVQPLEGLDRYTLTIFPLWMAAGAWLSERRRAGILIGVGACLLAFYSFEFATWAFIA